MSVEHELWHVKRWGIKTKQHFKNEFPFGIIVPLFFTIATLGFIKAPMFLTYETSALKHRAAKRFGFYSYTEVTEWHNSLVGAAGVISLFILSVFSYAFGFEYFAKMTAFYSFTSLIPLAKLDGTQIFFGSRILWTALSCLSVILCFY